MAHRCQEHRLGTGRVKCGITRRGQIGDQSAQRRNHLLQRVTKNVFVGRYADVTCQVSPGNRQAERTASAMTPSSSLDLTESSWSTSPRASPAAAAATCRTGLVIDAAIAHPKPIATINASASPASTMRTLVTETSSAAVLANSACWV